MGLHLWAIAETHAPRTPIRPGAEALGYAAGLLGWMIAGTVFVAFKAVAGEMPPWTMCFARAAISALALAPLVAARRHEMAALLRARGKELFFIGAIGLGLTQGMMFTALEHASPVSVSIVFATAPMLTMILAALLLGERMNLWQALGSAVAFCGIAVISVEGSAARLMALQFGYGDLLAIAAAAMFAGYTVLLKRAKFALPLMPLLVLLLASGSLAALPFAGFEYLRGEHETLGGQGLLALVYCATIGGAGLYLLYNRSIEALGAARAGTLVYTQMLFVAFFAWIFLGERLEWYHLVGAGLVAVGVLLITLLRPQPAAA